MNHQKFKKSPQPTAQTRALLRLDGRLRLQVRRFLDASQANAGLAFGGFWQALQQRGAELFAGAPARRMRLSLRRSGHAAAVVLPAQGTTARIDDGRNAHGLVVDIKTPSLGLGVGALVMAKTSRG